MPFPFGAALMGLSTAGSLGALFSGQGQVQGMGRIQRTMQAQMGAASAAQRYFDAAGDVTNPLFRQTAAMEESNLRRQIAEGVMSAQLQERKARARGLTAGVRPDTEDQSRNLAIGKLFEQASMQSGNLAQQRLMATGQGMLGVAQSYGQAAAGASNYAQMATAGGVANEQRFMQGADIIGMAGEAMGGGAQLNKLFGGTPSGYRTTNAPWAQYSGISPTYGQQPMGYGGYGGYGQMGPQFSWRGYP